jgi:hydroxyacylglutathione hydrolase
LYNPALQFTDQDSFVAYMNEGQPSRPANAENIVAINQGRSALTFELPSIHALTPDFVQKQLGDNYFIVDTRSPSEFGAAHIPGSYNIQLLSPEFEQRVGWVVPPIGSFVLVVENDEEAVRAQKALAFVGLDHRVAGYLEGGIENWIAAGYKYLSIPQITVDQLSAMLQRGNIKVLDVRDATEWDEGHMENALHMLYKQIPESLDTLDLSVEDEIAVVCAGGYRSSTASSILLRKGFHNISNVTGGVDAWRAARFTMIDGQGNVCRI